MEAAYVPASQEEEELGEDNLDQQPSSVTQSKGIRPHASGFLPWY